MHSQKGESNRRRRKMWSEKDKPMPRDVEISPTTEHLKVMLSIGDINERAKELARKTSEATSLQNELKEVASDFKAKILGMQTEAGRISEEINRGWIYKNVPCQEHKDFNLGTATVVRLDTLEVVRERALTADELQPKLIPEDPPEPPTIEEPQGAVGLNEGRGIPAGENTN
jgi:hypothetical protein